MYVEAMIYWTILTEKTSDEVAPIIRRIDEKVSQFREEYPDREDTLTLPWSERPEIYVQQARSSHPELTPEMRQRLDRCKSVLIFEGPANPQEYPDQVSVLKLYLEALGGSVMDWGGIDYGWPSIQTSEDALRSLHELPDEPRLSSEEPD
jgi:hypothetical protein